MAMKTQMPPTAFQQIGQIQAVEPDRPRVPLVGHIITDEDVGVFQAPTIEPVNLQKVVKLLADPHSEMLYDRHMHSLKKVIKYFHHGFLMKDLVTVYKMLNVCADRVDSQPLYVDPMCAIIKLCSRPFLKEKTSDETAFKQIAIESVSQLAYLMRVPSTKVRLQICRALSTFYCVQPKKLDVQRMQGSRLEYNQKIVEESDVAETLVRSLALLEHDLAVKIAVLDLLQKLSKSSNRNCELMLQAGAGTRLCLRMLDLDPSGQVLFRSVDCLWNLLENTPNEHLAKQLSTHKSVGHIRDAFIHQLTQGYSHYDRQLRNDLLVIASLVASVAHKSPFVETGFLKQLTIFATFQEVKSHNVLVRHLKLMQNPEDFELKKLLINILVILSFDSAVIPILSESRLLLALFSYVKANERRTGARDWTPAQFEELQLQAMVALCTFVPLMIEDYLMCQGSTRLLLLLEWCVGSDAYGGHGNSFHGIGGRGNKRAQMRHCLRLIRSIVSTGDEMALQDFTDQGAITQITGILMSMSNLNQEDAIDVEMQCDMLIILSGLCENDSHRKELFGNEGVDVCTEYLRKDPSKISSGLGHHRLILAAVDCIWSAIIGCYVTEDYFLEKEGIFLLIDLLETCPKNMHNLILGCLLDLCENPKAMTHINVWHGTDDISAAHLFCDLWRLEEVNMGVKRDPSGAIADIVYPLMGTLQAEKGITSMPAQCPSQAIVDVSENTRAKLYSLFGRIGFIELPGLTTEDHVTLTIIEHYLDFKLGEVWAEVIGELEQEGVRPVSPDYEALQAIVRTITERAGDIMDVQIELLEAQDQQDLIDEQEHFNEIREIHRQKEKTSQDFSEYVMRTSSYGQLCVAKEQQDISIDASRIQNNYKLSEAFHDTSLHTLNVTTFTGRHLQVESTPLELTGGPLVLYDPSKGTLQERTTSKRAELA